MLAVKDLDLCFWLKVNLFMKVSGIIISVNEKKALK